MSAGSCPVFLRRGEITPCFQMSGIEASLKDLCMIIRIIGVKARRYSRRNQPGMASVIALVGLIAPSALMTNW